MSDKFILRSDYITQIRDEVLEVIIDDNDDVLDHAENAAIDEVKSYLAQRFDTDSIFAPVNGWEVNDEHAIGDRVVLTDDHSLHVGDWLVADPYTANDHVRYLVDGFIYVCILNATAGILPTNATYFARVGKLNDIFVAVDTIGAGTRFLNAPAFWSAVDNRSALILRFLIDLILYEIHCRINPRNIPEHRIQRRDDAIKWLKGCADPRGNMNPNLPERTDHGTNKGVDITFGSNTKQSHYF